MSHRPSTTSPLASTKSPRPISSSAKPCPSAAGDARARGCGRRSRRQAIARAIRPPSSGKAGTRLNTSSERVDRRQPAQQRERRRRRWMPSQRRDVDEVVAVRDSADGRRRAQTPTIAQRDRGPGGGDAELLARRLGLARASSRCRRRTTGRCPRSRCRGAARRARGRARAGRARRRTAARRRPRRRRPRSSRAAERRRRK